MKQFEERWGQFTKIKKQYYAHAIFSFSSSIGFHSCFFFSRKFHSQVSTSVLSITIAISKKFNR
jgi:hypothetical protein